MEEEWPTEYHDLHIFLAAIEAQCQEGIALAKSKPARYGTGRDGSMSDALSRSNRYYKTLNIIACFLEQTRSFALEVLLAV